MNSKGGIKRKLSPSVKEEAISRINNEDELLTAVTNEDGNSSDAENDAESAGSDAESDGSDMFGAADSGALSLGDDEDDDTDSEFSEYGTDADEEEAEDDDEDDDDDDDDEEEEDSDDLGSERDEVVNEDSDGSDAKADHHKKRNGKQRISVKGKNSSEEFENEAGSYSEDDGIENDYDNDQSGGEKKEEKKTSNTDERQETRLQSKAKQAKKVQSKAQKISSIASPSLKSSSKKSSTVTEIAPDGVNLVEDEYAYDTSDEEDVRNTVGNIPMNWYDDYQHLGYDWEGKKILKPVKEDELDSFLRRMEDPNFWRTVRDPQTGQEVVLSEEDVDIIQRLQAQKIPDPNFNDEAPWVEWFTSEVMQTPIVRVPDHKRSFLPSRIEAKKIAKMVHSLKMGWMKPREEKEKEKEKKKEPNFYMLWQTDEGVEHMRRIHNHIPAPKRHLPGHAESYNPPSEYLFDKKELKQWNRLKDAPWKRKLHFIPQKYPSLRQVPAYDRYIKERFQRCLDLYLCPRARKMRLTIEPEDLLPQLPNPKDLQPFPTVMSMVYEGHMDMVRCITVEPKGQYIASGSDDLTVKVWEIATGRCVRTIPVGGVVRSLSWCPNQALSLIAVAADRKVLLVNPDVGDHLVRSKTDSLLKEAPEQDFVVPERVKAAVQWEVPEEEHWNRGIRVIINHFKEVKQVTWHGRGDYFATVMPDGQNRSVIIHQLSKRRSQVPFSKSKGLIQCVLFHPIRPFFFVASQRNIRVYDLAKQELVKKLQSNSKWISSMAVHPGGDNLLVGTYDRKMLWFDLDLSTKPYQTLRLHNTAVRGVAYHKQYPLFASGSDDCSVIVCHGMVYNDLLQNPLIVPLKRLSHHEYFDDFGVFDVIFHPTQPWVFSSGADKKIRLYT